MTRPRHCSSSSTARSNRSSSRGDQREDRRGFGFEHLARERAISHERTSRGASAAPRFDDRVDGHQAAEQRLEQVEPQRVLRVALRARPAPRALRGTRRRRPPPRRPTRAARCTRARPAVTPSPPPGSCRLCVTSNTTGTPCCAHHRKRAHVDDQVVIAEARAALGDDDARVAGVDDLRDRVLHVVGREELPLLDVDDAPGLRRGDEQVGLPARGTPESAARRRRRPPAAACDGSWMSVRIGTSKRALIAASTRRPSSSPGPRNERPDVRFALSYDALKMNGTPTRARDVGELGRRDRVACASLSMTHGPGDQDERAAAADRDVAELERGHGRHYTGRVGRAGRVGRQAGLRHRLDPPSHADLRPRWRTLDSRSAAFASCADTPRRRTPQTADAAASAST